MQRYNILQMKLIFQVRLCNQKTELVHILICAAIEDYTHAEFPCA